MGAARAAAVALLAAAAQAAVIDRVAVVVGNTVITETEVQREVRLTEFLNGQPLDLGPKERRAAAERMVDQQLIRNEMENGGYTMPAAAEGPEMLRDFRRRHYASEAALRAALHKYGITEEELQQHLLWEAAALRFTDQRFQPGAPETPGANRMQEGAAGNGVDEQLDRWLKEQRSNTRIEFKPGAFR